MANVISGKTFKEAAEGLGLEYATLSIGDKKTEMPQALAKYFDQAAEGPEDAMIAIVEILAVGTIYDHIVEDDYGYRVIRLMEKNDKKYTLESISVRKRPFDEWFRERAGKLKIEIFDADMKKKILTEYPEVWWVKEMPEGKITKK